MGSIAAAILTIAKAVPAAERLLVQVVDLYSAWKRQQNAKDEAEKNSRNDALVDGAAAGVGVLDNCPTCGAPSVGGGQHGTSGTTSTVPVGSGVRT